MKENNKSLKSNLQKLDNHEISPAEYADIPELPEDFFIKGQCYRNSTPVKRTTHDKQKKTAKSRLTIRLNNEVIDFFKNQGNGWQGSINDILQQHVDLHHIA